MPRGMDPGPFEVRLPFWVRVSEWVIERMLCGLRPRRGGGSDCPTYGRGEEN